MSPSSGSQKTANMEKKPAPLASQMLANGITKSTIAVVAVPAPPAQSDTKASEEAIRHHAYLKWLVAGKPEGNGVNFWLEAEQEHMQGK